MVEEEPRRCTVYRLRMGGHEQTGLAGTFSVDEYNRDIIKKHEKTRRTRKTIAPGTSSSSARRRGRCS